MRLGKYQLLRKLATGGMAEVFLAKTDGPMGFEKHLVIKRILPHLAEDPQFVEMFLGEAKLAAQLNHPNLVQLFDFGEAEGSYFIAMEFIDGPTLRLLLARARDLRAPPSFAISARIVSLAAEGLAYAHDFRDQLTDEPLGLVHRDVSPDNILVGRSGAVKLVDFGIAKARGQTHHTQAGTVKGKVAYMAPEQLRGEALDRRVDLYSLGVVLYELCTGRMPFEANSDASMVRAVLYDAAVPAVRRVSNLPPPIQAILDRLLAKDRNARYPDCRTLHADLETFIRSTGEATNGFALSRMVAQLAPQPAPPQPTPPRPTQLPPGVTASAFAPTSSSPILLSEPVHGAAPVGPPPLEALDLDRTVRSDPRRHPPPPVAGLDVRPLKSNTPAAGSGFVFPTALEDERLAVTPVTIGMERPDTRRRTTGTMRRLGGGEGHPLRIMGVTLLFGVLAIIGAYLGLVAAHRVDLLARVGLPVPDVLAPTSQQGTTPPAPVAATPPGPATTPATPPAVARGDAPAPGAPSTAAPEVPPPALPAPGTGPATPPALPAAPVAPAPLAGAATNAPAPSAGSTPGTTAAPRAPPSTPERTARPGPAGAAAAGVAATAAGAAEGTPAKPSTAAATPKAPRESDRDKLLGAFAELEAAKESTVRLESTPKLKVRMGGKIVGTTPVTLTVPAQDAPVELEFFDTTLGVSKAEQLTLKPGDNGIHKVEIARGKLVLKVDEGVTVSVDGKAMGTTPLDPISLFEGKHTVQLTRGDQKEKRTLEIQGDEETELEFSFPEAE
ncbi:MAG TPA: protein kinase [Myxococcaceae bacterium]|nr:protein kinase [Myxococcaceae bacterium]